MTGKAQLRTHAIKRTSRKQTRLTVKRDIRAMRYDSLASGERMIRRTVDDGDDDE
jgi:hypothetical protein